MFILGDPFNSPPGKHNRKPKKSEPTGSDTPPQQPKGPFENASEDIREFTAALIKAKKAFAAVKKTAEGEIKNRKYRYATLSNILDAIGPALNENNLALIQHTVPTGTGICKINTRLIHAPSGQWIGCSTEIPCPSDDPQAWGTVITYVKKYAISALIGIVFEEDDQDGKLPENGNSPVMHPVRPAPDAQPPAATQQSYDDLPILAGVEYESGLDDKGRPYIVAKGSEVPQKRQYLEMAGFRRSKNGIWWKWADQPPMEKAA